MSVPASLRGGATTTNTLTSKKYLIYHLLSMWFSALPPLLLAWDYWSVYLDHPISYFIFLPLYSIVWYFLWVFDSILISKFFLVIVNIVHKPREGYFPRSKRSKDYRAWSRRATIKKFAFWVVHNFPLPWLDIIAFKMFGVKTTFTTPMFDAWIDTEFIELGDHVIMGQGSVIMSSMVTRDWLIIQKVTIGKNCLVGAHAVVSPGTTFGDNCILGALSGTSIGQELEAGWVYMGVPCRKYHKNTFMSLEESDEEMARKRDNFKQFLTVDETDEEEKKQKFKAKRIDKKDEKIGLKIERMTEEISEIKEIIEEKNEDEFEEKEISKLKKEIKKLEDKIKKRKIKKEDLKERKQILSLEEAQKIERYFEKINQITLELEKEEDEKEKIKLMEKIEKIQDKIKKEKTILIKKIEGKENKIQMSTNSGDIFDSASQMQFKTEDGIAEEKKRKLADIQEKDKKEE